jgi:glycosyltransferase involved in cell wall biosynthesis
MYIYNFLIYFSHLKIGEPRMNFNDPKVCVLLAYCNGSDFINVQLESIKRQTHQNIFLLVCDDASEKSEFLKLAECLKSHSFEFDLIRREQKVGAGANFLFGLQETPEDCDYFAFCDQDDIWFVNKLEQAINTLSKTPQTCAAVYCSRTEIVGPDGKLTLGFSPLMKREPSFQNALTQNIAGGNTMVLNNAARKLVVDSSRNKKIIFHDWWTYLIVSASGGSIFYDPIPSLKYRQHEYNLIGSNTSIGARVRRFGMMLEGHYRFWNDMHVAALEKNKAKFTPDSIQTFEKFKKIKAGNLLERTYCFLNSSIRRQSLFGNIALLLAILMKKY